MNVLVIEDEPAAARKLVRLLEQDPRVDAVAGQADSVESALAWLGEHPRPDLIFSDIELGDGLSFEIFRDWPECPPIVFVTAFDQYALQAFRVPGIDYLLKPVSASDLQGALDKFLSLRAEKPDLSPDRADLQQAFEALGFETGPVRRFLVRMGERLRALEVQEAAYYYVEDRVVFYMAVDGKRYPLDQSLDDVERLLDPDRFFRINRQYIVRDDAIQDMVVVSKSRVKLNLLPKPVGDTIVSKERSPVFRQWIQGLKGQG
jgi:two-component system response regulator LytT